MNNSTDKITSSDDSIMLIEKSIEKAFLGLKKTVLVLFWVLGLAFSFTGYAITGLTVPFIFISVIYFSLTLLAFIYFKNK